jgi:antitoxin ChpS
MPHATRLRRVGGSVMLAIPKPMLEALDLTSDASVGLSIKAGRLVIDPKKRRRYSLDELLAQCKPSARRSREDLEWATSPPVGRELI